MHVEWVVQHIYVVVCARLWCNPVPRHWYIHTYQVRCWIVRNNSLGVPELPVECHNAKTAQHTVEYPNDETRPNENVPFAISEDLNVVVH